MYKFVDQEDDLEGFAYYNQFNEIEKVHLQGDTVIFREDDGELVSAVYIDDIPKLIKALQAAYDCETKGDK